MTHGGNMYDTKVTVELDCDTVDNLVKNELQKVYESLKRDLDRVADGTSWAIFDKDQAKDIALITEHIYALELILIYYGAWSGNQ
jgi:predicted mannosyl-3-phosphoglycerate phosphatase (HAD superfamily)